MNLHSLDIHRSFVHSTPPPPPPRFVVNNHPSPLSFSTHFGAGEKREAQQGSSPKKRKEKRREGKGREEKKERSFTKLIVIPHNHNEEWNDRSYHVPRLVPRPSGRVQDEGPRRTRITTPRYDNGDGWWGGGHARIIPEGVETEKNGEKRRHQEGWAPSWSVALADPHPVYKPSSAGYVFSLSVRTAHCVYNPNRSSSCTGSRSLGRWLAERKRTVAGCLAVCAPLSSPWYVPHIPRIDECDRLPFLSFIFLF